MMKILVCLISDQHIPNLLTVHAVKPDLLVLIVTPDMERKNAAANFLKALEIGGMKELLNKDRHKIVPLKEENSIPIAKKVFQDIIKDYSEDEWIVNITGGTKPMSIAAFEFFKSRNNTTMVYVPINDQSRALNFTREGESLKLDHEVTIGQFLAGYGFELLKDKSEVIEKETLVMSWFDASIYLVAHCNDQEVKRFLKSLSTISGQRNGRKNGLTILDSDELYLMDDALLSCLASLFPSIKLKNNSITGSLNANEVEFLTGGWLECFILILLSKHSDKLGIREVHLNLEVISRGPIAARPKNEWEITFMHGQSLCFIECKTGDQKGRRESEILYKVEAIKKQLGALRVKSYLATTSPIVIDKITGKIKEHLATRAALYNCKIIEGEKLQRIAQMQMVETDESRQIELIRSLFELNPKAQ